MKEQNKHGIWIALVDVTPGHTNSMLGDADGALVNVLAISKDPAHFRRIVTKALSDVDFQVKSIDDIRPFHKSSEVGSAVVYLDGLASRLTKESPAICDEFQPYYLDSTGSGQ